ncbi:MAG: helix-turn-helix transcriptional regulator [Flavobacteriaceae bacterium]|nr:helix-turn-helix transcriptional regulator [Flavobacteriaceae bacterium]
MKKQNLSSVIKKTRIEKNLSQEELSEISNLSLRTVQRIENNDTTPRGDTLNRLTKALNLPDNYFNNITNEQKIVKQIPWFIIGFILFGGSFGFLIGLILVNMKVIPYNDIAQEIVYSITSLFIAIGIIVGNIIEKKHRNEKD